MRTIGRYAFTAALAVALQTHAARTGAASDNSTGSAGPGVGAQYDGTPGSVPQVDMTSFITSFTATFGGRSTKPATTTVTPTPSSTTFAAVQTPAGPLSVFAFTTPVPYPFGAERTGYLVNDMDAAISAAKEAGADVLVAPFPDPIGRDAVNQWPGGVNMQLYWHTIKPSYAALATIPENRVYVSSLRADAFIAEFLRFSKGHVVSDNGQAPGVEDRAVTIAAERGLRLPLVYNTGGYDSLEALNLLDGVIDIYMPDMKYGDDTAAPSSPPLISSEKTYGLDQGQNGSLDVRDRLSYRLRQKKR